MSEKRFTTDYSDFLQNSKTFIKMDNERLTYEEIVDLLNEQTSIIRRDEISIQTMMSNMEKLEEEKIELMEDNACQYREIQKLESENDDLRTTITKQVEAITEMKDIIYMLQDLRIGDYSSKIEEDMQELKKAYDGTLEDFLNYFKDE